MIKLLFLIIFGSNLFGGKPMEISPYQQAPEGYVLGRGDSIAIDIFGASQLQIKERINIRGEITIPNYGPICLSGKTVAGAEAYLNKKLVDRYAESMVNISLEAPRRIRVTIKGEVENPGEYLLHGYSNLLMAIQEAGGVTEVGSMRHIELNGNREIDLYDYLLGELDVKGILLKEGDEIVVKMATSLMEITGYVKRPMTYELNESQVLSDLIEYAGGLTEDEYEVRVTHRQAESARMHTVPETEINQYQLKDGDLVSIEKKSDNPEEVIHVMGNVRYPGKYHLSSTKHQMLSEILDIATPQASEKKNLVVVYRDTMLVQVGNAEMKLQGRENIMILPAIVSTQGEVIYEGDVDYREGMTAKEYIQAAGGYSKKAQRSKAYIVNPNGQVKRINKDITIVPGSRIVIPRR